MRTKLFYNSVYLFFFIFLTGCSHEELAVMQENIQQETWIASLSYDAQTRRFFSDKTRTEYYTGIAIERNDNGDLTRQYEYDNGTMVKAKIWTDFNGQLKQTIDMKYKDHRAYNGWYNILLILPNDGKMTNIYSRFENGEKVEGWNLHRKDFTLYYTPFDEERTVLCEANNQEEFYEKVKKEIKELNPIHFQMFSDGHFITTDEE